MSPSLVIARFETPNFTVEGVGTNEQWARRALEEAWKIHARQTDADPEYLDEHADDVQIVVYEPGHGYRDGEAITPYAALDTRRLKTDTNVVVTTKRYGTVMGHRDGGPEIGLVDVRMTHDHVVYTYDTGDVLAVERG